jgi:hypothetical protein
MAEIRIIQLLFDQAPSYIKDGPMCYCGQHDWIIKSGLAVCSNCGREKKGQFSSYVVNGPKCYCGHFDWFASNDEWICSNCGRKK